MKLHLKDLQNMKRGPNKKRRKGKVADIQFWGMPTFKDQAEETEVRVEDLACS